MSDEQTFVDEPDEEFADEETLDESDQTPDPDDDQSGEEDAPPADGEAPEEQDDEEGVRNHPAFRRLLDEVGAQGAEIGLMRAELKAYRAGKTPDETPGETATAPDDPVEATAKELYQSRGRVLVNRWYEQGLSDEDIRADADCQRELRYIWEDCRAIAGATEKRVQSAEDRVRGEVSPLLQQRAVSEINADVTGILTSLNLPASVTVDDLSAKLERIPVEVWRNTPEAERAAYVEEIAYAALGRKGASAAKAPATPPRTAPAVGVPKSGEKAPSSPQISRAAAMLLQANPNLTPAAAEKAASRYIRNGGKLNG